LFPFSLLVQRKMSMGDGLGLGGSSGEGKTHRKTQAQKDAEAAEKGGVFSSPLSWRALFGSQRCLRCSCRDCEAITEHLISRCRLARCRYVTALCTSSVESEAGV
jgi:hypothetical protein